MSSFAVGFLEGKVFPMLPDSLKLACAYESKLKCII